jgi:CheY-like chemotaxis protein
VRKAQDEKPDVILLDVMMPTMDGLETLAALRSRPATASTPVIFLTAKAVGDQVERMTSLGAAGVLIKPFDPRTLSQDVRAFVNRQRDPDEGVIKPFPSRRTRTWPSGRGRKRTQTASRKASPASSDETYQQGLDEMRQRFVATFVAQCDSMRTLVDKVAALGPRGPVTALTQITHRLSGLAGTIGFPTISARVSDLGRPAFRSQRMSRSRAARMMSGSFRWRDP